MALSCLLQQLGRLAPRPPLPSSGLTLRLVDAGKALQPQLIGNRPETRHQVLCPLTCLAAVLKALAPILALVRFQGDDEGDRTFSALKHPQVRGDNSKMSEHTRLPVHLVTDRGAQDAFRARRRVPELL